MLILDIVLGLIVLYGAYRGFKNGLIVELFGILAWAIGIYGALHFSDWTADQLKPYVSWSENATKTASFVLTFLALLLITHLLAKALTKIFPDLDGFIGGCGIRVPVPDGSLTDLSCVVKKNTNIHEINYLFEKAAQTELKGILEYTEDPIVSVDVIVITHSCIFDAGLTSVIGKMVKVVGWYDNEVGYSNRIKDLILKIA